MEKADVCNIRSMQYLCS